MCGDSWLDTYTSYLLFYPVILLRSLASTWAHWEESQPSIDACSQGNEATSISFVIWNRTRWVVPFLDQYTLWWASKGAKRWLQQCKLVLQWPGIQALIPIQSFVSSALPLCTASNTSASVVGWLANTSLPYRGQMQTEPHLTLSMQYAIDRGKSLSLLYTCLDLNLIAKWYAVCIGPGSLFTVD